MFIFNYHDDFDLFPAWEVAFSDFWGRIKIDVDNGNIAIPYDMVFPLGSTLDWKVKNEIPQTST